MERKASAFIAGTTAAASCLIYCGTEQRDGHWGMIGMRERALRIGGKLEVSSKFGVGTELEVRVPGPAAYTNSTGLLGFILRVFEGLRQPRHRKANPTPVSSEVARADFTG
jgi:hypothetical protein